MWNNKCLTDAYIRLPLGDGRVSGKIPVTRSWSHRVATLTAASEQEIRRGRGIIEVNLFGRRRARCSCNGDFGDGPFDLFVVIACGPTFAGPGCAGASGMDERWRHPMSHCLWPILGMHHMWWVRAVTSILGGSAGWHACSSCSSQSTGAIHLYRRPQSSARCRSAALPAGEG